MTTFEAAELDRLRKDAARYRWLADVVIRARPRLTNFGPAWVVEDFIAPVAYGETLDAAIDAAIAGSQSLGSESAHES